MANRLVDRAWRSFGCCALPKYMGAISTQLADISRTKSCKIVELAVRNVVHGEPVKNVEALANPEALEHFRDRSELAI